MTKPPQCMRMTFAGLPAAQWRVGRSEFVAVPSCGARLAAWTMDDGNGRRLPLIYWPEETDDAEFALVRGGNPILFPFCARTFVDGRIHCWRDPGGVVRSMPLHGFARQAEFTVTRLNEDGFTAVMLPGDEARFSYPYEYRFTVDYSFRSDGLRVGLSLENLGVTPLPWSAGHHFYVVAPWSAGRTRRDYELRCPAISSWVQGADGALLPGPGAEWPRTLDDLGSRATMHGPMTGDVCTLVEKGSGARLQMYLPNARRDFPDAMINTWTADERAPYYCLEPWMGPDNASGLGRGVDWVPPGARRSFVVELQFFPAFNPS